MSLPPVQREVMWGRGGKVSPEVQPLQESLPIHHSWFFAALRQGSAGASGFARQSRTPSGKKPLFLFHLAETELEFSMRNFASETGNQTSPKVLEKKKTKNLFYQSVDFHCDQSTDRRWGKGWWDAPPTTYFLHLHFLPSSEASLPRWGSGSPARGLL